MGNLPWHIHNNIQSNSVLLRTGEDNVYFFWKFYEDCLNSFKLWKNMWETLTEYYGYVAIETTQIDIHSNNVLLSVEEDNIYFHWKFHEDWLNSFWVRLQYVKKLKKYSILLP